MRVNPFTRPLNPAPDFYGIAHKINTFEQYYSRGLCDRILSLSPSLSRLKRIGRVVTKSCSSEPRIESEYGSRGGEIADQGRRDNRIQSIPLIVPAVGPQKNWHYSRFGTTSNIFVN